MSSQRPSPSRLLDSPLSRSQREKENASISSYGSSPKLTPQRAQKMQAREARAKVLKERAQQAEMEYEAENARRRSMGYSTDEQIRKSVEKDIRESRKAHSQKEEEPEGKRLSLSPSKAYDTTHETSWSKFMKWVPLNTPTSTALDQDGYAVPTTIGTSHHLPQLHNDLMRTPERTKSPENELFFTPAAKMGGSFSSSFGSPAPRETLSADKSLLTRMEEDFQKKLALESTKIGLVARKTIQGLEQVEKILDDDKEKTWKSPTKKISRSLMPEFSGMRQSHPITMDHGETRMSLPGAPGFASDSEETLDGVSPLHSEVEPLPRATAKVATGQVEASRLPKTLGAQLHAEINYVETGDQMAERLDEVQEMVNRSRAAAAETEANLSAMLNNIELFDHSLPHMSLTPKQRFRGNKPVPESPKTPVLSTPKSSARSQQVRTAERTQAYQSLVKALAECQETTKRFVNQQKKVHELVKDLNSPDCYSKVIETYLDGLKEELVGKKAAAKERLEWAGLSDTEFIAWTREEAEALDNRIKFFSLIWMDLGKFILKYNVQAPSIPAVGKVPEQGKEWKVVVVKSDESEKEAESSVSRGESEKEQEGTVDQWEESLKEPETPSSMDQAFVGQEEESPVKRIEQDLWDESLKEPSFFLPAKNEAEAVALTPKESGEESGSIQEDVVVEETEEEVPTPILSTASSIEEAVEQSEVRASSESGESTPIASPQSPEPAFQVEETEQPPLDIVPEIVEEVSAVPKIQDEAPETVPVQKTPERPPSTLEEVSQPTLWNASASLEFLLSPKTPSSVPPLELSLLHSSGRQSIGVDKSLLDEERLDDFLNRSGRRDSQRYKLDISLLNDSVTEEQPFPAAKISPKRDQFNESFPKSPISPQLVKSPAAKAEVPKITFDLNITEEEMLEDIKKPEPLHDFTMTAAVSEYEKKHESQDKKWEEFMAGGIEYKMDRIREAVDIVWQIKQQEGGIPFEKQSNWTAFIQEHEAEKVFDDAERQEMYNSDWLGVLGDVFEIGGDLFPMQCGPDYKSLYYPYVLPNMSKEKFTEICRKHLVDKKRSTLVETVSRDYNWDADPARRNAHEMVIDVHHIYLKKELFSARDLLIDRAAWDVAEELLEETVQKVLKGPLA